MVPDFTPAGSSGGWVVNFINYYANATNLLQCPAGNRAPGPPDGGGNSQGSATQPWVKKLDGNLYLSGYGVNGWFYSDAAGDGKGYTLPSGQPGTTAYFGKD